MKRVFVVLMLLFVMTGCASTIESTPAPAPAQPNSQQVAPTSQAAATQPAPPPSKCQSKVTGRVLDAKGALLKGAAIEIKNGSFTAKTLSDDNGLYGFAGLCGGTFSFTVQPNGQAAKAVAANVTVDGSNSTKVDLTIK